MSATVEPTAAGGGHGHGPDRLPRPPWFAGRQDLNTITEAVSEITERPVPAWWWAAFSVSSALLLSGVFAAVYLISTGVGVWGEQIPVGWAFDITNFVFWIGIGHAGTLISAILFLLRQKWRTSINRFSEAMTLFAVICAGVYPGIHVGRFWYAWFLAPLPNANHIWPNFKSPLCWDAFAVSTYFTVSLLFWYTGLIPDLATLRDRAPKGSWRQKIFAALSFGWRGSSRNWQHYEAAYLTLAGISTPLVLSVHSIVSFDFATSVLPGWHTTIFPPYFVAGAIFGGFAMVLQCMIPARAMYPQLKTLVTINHIEIMAQVILATGSLVGYAYIMEFFIAWYSGSDAEQITFYKRMFKEYWWAYWTMMTCNLIVPQIFWFKYCRTTPWVVFVAVVFVNIGMWFERFVIIVSSLYQNAWGIESAAGEFRPTWVDWMQMFGDFGLFFFLTLLFIRFLPMLAMSELKPLTPGAGGHHHDVYNPRTDENKKPERPYTSSGWYESGVGEKGDVMLARYESPDQVVHAAKALRDAGYRRFDTYTPFPVHGMFRAMGMRRSRMPWVSLLGTLVGGSIGFGMMHYIQYWDYPIVVGGKDYAPWQPMVPILFELCILFTAFFTVGGMLLMSGLPKFYSPLFKSGQFERVTTDGFFVAVEASDAQYEVQHTRELLAAHGGTDIELLEARP